MKADVEAVLDALGAGARNGQTVIEAWNKIDRLAPEDAEDAIWRSRLPRRPDRPAAAAVSAATGAGVEALMRLVEEALGEDDPVITLALARELGEAAAWLHRNADILDERVDRKTGVRRVTARLTPADLGRFNARFPDFEAQLLSQAGRWLEAAE
jgi:GTP-binding protein HflX